MKGNINEPRIIVAHYNENTVRVYQAYSNVIADEAVKLGTFGPSFKMERMTWIKPSFLWMMYREGWGTKPSQERVLAIDIKREGFDEILSNVVLSTFDSRLYGTYEHWKKKMNESNVRCQWDPDRDIFGNPIGRRAIQLGISGSMVNKYVNEWINRITDISDEVHKWHHEILAKRFDPDVLPRESEYPVSEDVRAILAMQYI